MAKDTQAFFNPDADQRVSVLIGLPDLLAEMGGSSDGLREEFLLPADFFSDPDRRVPFSLASRILGRAAEMLNCDHLGLLLGARFDEKILGLPGQWLRQAPTLGQGLAGFCALQQANTRAAALYLHRLDEDEVFLGYGIYDRGASAHEQVYALTIAVALRTTRSVTGTQIRPTEAFFPFRPPPSIVPFHAILGCPVRFNQAKCGLILKRSDMGLPIVPGRKVSLGDWLKRAVNLTPPPNRVWATKVAHALRPLIHYDLDAKAQVASELGVSVRTLTRRLSDEGTDFSEVHDELRFTTACELLALTDMTVGEVAHAVAFNSQAAFARAFRRWSGRSPSELRARSVPSFFP